MKKSFKTVAWITAFALAIAIPILTGTETVEVEYETAKIGDIEVYLEVIGEIQANKTYTVTYPMGGRVSEVLVREGDKVSAGQIVINMDGSEYEKQLKEVSASIDKAESLETSNTQGGLSGQISKEVALSLAQNASCDINGFNSAVRGQISLGGDAAVETFESYGTKETIELETKADELKRQIDEASLKTSIGGTVLSVNINEGDTVAAGTPCAVIGDTSAYKITAFIGEGDICEISEGMNVAILAGSGEKDFKGIIRSIGKSVESLQSTSGIKKGVYVTITPEESFTGIVGSSLDLKIEQSKAENTMYVPIDSVDAEGNMFVVNGQNVIEKRKVTTGISNDYFIEVTSGLSMLDKVVVSPQKELEEGMRVKVL